MNEKASFVFYSLLLPALSYALPTMIPLSDELISGAQPCYTKDCTYQPTDPRYGSKHCQDLKWDTATSQYTGLCNFQANDEITIPTTFQWIMCPSVGLYHFFSMN